MGGFALAIRLGVLRLIPLVYRAGLVMGTVGLVALGGFVPLIRAWLANRISSAGEIVEFFGGVQVSRETRDPDNDLGPLIRRPDAPRLFDEVLEVARRLGVRPPEELRLAFLPCCGVVAWRDSRSLLLGLPLLHVLTISELRAILGHELAHLARGDATWSAGSIRFVEGLSQALDRPDGRAWGLLGFWARACRRLAAALVEPIARGQEARADRTAASLAGGRVAASALVKVALVQPLFRELLCHQNAGRSSGRNLYASFRSFWDQLPPPLLEAMRLRLMGADLELDDATHPPLPDRIIMILAYPDRPEPVGDLARASTLIGDPEWFEQMLQERLFGLAPVEPTIFHKSGT